MVNRSSENEKELHVKLEWVPVQGPDGKPYFYRADHKRLRKAWSKPAVYRWVLSGKKRTLVGESDDLHQRLQAYVGSGLGRHVEIRRVFDEELKSEGSVQLEVLKFEGFTINGIVFDETSLHSFFVRRVLENICSELLQRDGHELLNATPQKRLIGKAAREFGVTPEVLVEALRLVISRKAAGAPSH